MRNLFVAAILALTTAGAAAGELGPEILLPASPRPAHDPCVAFGDGKYLVVWQSGRADRADLYACRLDAAANVLDAQPIAVSTAFDCQEHPRAAWGNDAWLVVWADLRNDKDYDIYAARVGPDGKVLDPEGIFVAGGAHNQCRPDVAWNGSAWLVVWRAWETGGGKNDGYALHGARISPDGKMLDTQPVLLASRPSSDSSVSEARVAPMGKGWLVSWVGRGTAMASVAPYRGPGLTTAIVSAEGKPSAWQGILPKGVEEGGRRGSISAPLALASDGAEVALISWPTPYGTGRSATMTSTPFGAATVDSQGNLSARVELGAKWVHVELPAAAWDGKGFVLAYYDSLPPTFRSPEARVQNSRYEEKIVACLISREGQFEWRALITPGTVNPGYAPDVAGDGKGNALVVWERHPADEDAADAAIFIAARLLKR